MSALGRHNSNTAVSRWADRHGLIPELLPIAGRDTNSIELAQEAAANIADLPKTASSFRVDEVLPEARGYTVTVFRALGSWPYPGEFAQQRWVNPNYIHAGALGDVTDHREADRLEIVKECAALGVLTVDEVAPRFGVSSSSLTDWLHRRDVYWSNLRREGRRRFARTLYTATEWGYSQSEVVDPWPVHNGTLSVWMQRYAREAGFKPPADPSIDGTVGVQH